METPACRWPDALADNLEAQLRVLADCEQVFEAVGSGTSWNRPDRALLQSEAFAGYRQRRVVVEHRLARLVELGIRQSRYFGRIKTRFQLYLAATVANLTLVAAKASLPADTEGEFSIGITLRTGTIRSAFDFVPAQLGQILTLVLLTSASLPKYISLNKAFRPDFYPCSLFLLVVGSVCGGGFVFRRCPWLPFPGRCLWLGLPSSSAPFFQALPWFDFSGFSLVFVRHYVSSLGCLCRALRYHP